MSPYPLAFLPRWSGLVLLAAVPLAIGCRPSVPEREAALRPERPAEAKLAPGPTATSGPADATAAKAAAPTATADRPQPQPAVSPSTRQGEKPAAGKGKPATAQEKPPEPQEDTLPLELPTDPRPLDKQDLSPEQRKRFEELIELQKNTAPIDPTNPEHVRQLDRRLGPPLVDRPEKLVRLHPDYQLWVDKPPRRVILVGAVCQRQVPLELFACLKGSKEHEAVLSVFVKAFMVHAALVAAGAEPGAPVQFEPAFAPPRGTEIEIALVFKDLRGKTHQARAQDWVRQTGAHKGMDNSWVFAGSRLRVNEQTGERQYWADGDGNLISLSNFASAMLDVPLRSSDANQELSFECFTEHIPARGTAVTMILTPKAGKGRKGLGIRD